MSNEQIRFSCHGCGKRMKAPAAAAGRSARCLSCATPIIVPGIPVSPLLLTEPPLSSLALSESNIADGATGGRGRLQSIRAGVDATLRKAWPAIRRLFHEHVGPAAIKAVTSKEAFHELCLQVHRRLPRIVRRMVNQEVFAAFMIKKRDKLLAGIESDPEIHNSQVI